MDPDSPKYENELMKDGISIRNAGLSEEEIHQKIKKNLFFKEKLKSMRKRYNNPS